MELVPSLNNPEMSPKDETVASSINNKILTGILFEFCYSILLQFSLEELSQVANTSRNLVSTSSLHHWYPTSWKYNNYSYSINFKGSPIYFTIEQLVADTFLFTSLHSILSGLPRCHYARDLTPTPLFRRQSRSWLTGTAAEGSRNFSRYYSAAVFQ